MLYGVIGHQFYSLFAVHTQQRLSHSVDKNTFLFCFGGLRMYLLVHVLRHACVFKITIQIYFAKCCVTPEMTRIGTHHTSTSLMNRKRENRRSHTTNPLPLIISDTSTPTPYFTVNLYYAQPQTRRKRHLTGETAFISFRPHSTSGCLGVVEEKLLDNGSLAPKCR